MALPAFHSLRRTRDFPGLKSAPRGRAEPHLHTLAALPVGRPGARPGDGGGPPAGAHAWHTAHAGHLGAPPSGWLHLQCSACRLRPLMSQYPPASPSLMDPLQPSWYFGDLGHSAFDQCKRCAHCSFAVSCMSPLNILCELQLRERKQHGRGWDSPALCMSGAMLLWGYSCCCACCCCC